MTSSLLAPPQPRASLLRDARPPALTLGPPPGRRAAGADSSAQPPLAFADATGVNAGQPRPVGHRVLVLADPATAPPAGLPDPATWSASLALALAETLHGQRPPGQLSRWVDERCSPR